MAPRTLRNWVHLGQSCHGCPASQENVGLPNWREAAGRPGRAWAQRSEVRECLGHLPGKFLGDTRRSGRNWLGMPVGVPGLAGDVKVGHGEGHGGRVGRRAERRHRAGHVGDCLAERTCLSGRRAGAWGGRAGGPPPPDPHVEPLWRQAQVWGQVTESLARATCLAPRAAAALGSDGHRQWHSVLVACALSPRPVPCPHGLCSVPAAGASAGAHPEAVAASSAELGQPSAP